MKYLEDALASMHVGPDYVSGLLHERRAREAAEARAERLRASLEWIATEPAPHQHTPGLTDPATCRICVARQALAEGEHETR